MDVQYAYLYAFNCPVGVIWRICRFYLEGNWREKSNDERENLHKLIAGRFAFLADVGILVLATIVEDMSGQIDVWIIIALGGVVSNSNYEKVSSGKTGYAEAIEIKYNSNEIAYADLLNVFFATHDPTTLNRQGVDVGAEYRSVIFYSNEEEKNKHRILLPD